MRPKSASKVSDIQRSQHVLPSLKAALDATDNPDINSACLIALGKAAIQHPEFDVLEVLRTRLKRANLEVREVAVLALGLTGRSDVFDDLDGIMRNTKAGRKLVGRDSVEDRARTFAARQRRFPPRCSGDQRRRALAASGSAKGVAGCSEDAGKAFAEIVLPYTR